MSATNGERPAFGGIPRPPAPTVYRDYRKESRREWGRETPTGPSILGRDELQLGAILRIADALEELLDAVRNLDPDVRRRRAEVLLLRRQRVRRQEEARRRREAERAARGVPRAERVAGGDAAALDRPVLSLPWSVRTRNRLESLPPDLVIGTVRDLALFTGDELADQIPGCGPGMVREFREVLAAVGVRLWGDPGGASPVPSPG